MNNKRKKKKKKKTEEYVEKRLKNHKRNAQELSNFIKRPNLKIVGIEEKEEVQAKVMGIYSVK
jgi:hypothetical protein